MSQMKKMLFMGLAKDENVVKIDKNKLA